jgi:hypothetical protein
MWGRGCPGFDPVLALTVIKAYEETREYYVEPQTDIPTQGERRRAEETWEEGDFVARGGLPEECRALLRSESNQSRKIASTAEPTDTLAHQVQAIRLSWEELAGLPEHLQLPVLWTRYLPIECVLETTVEKLLSIRTTDAERTWTRSGEACLADLVMPLSLWARSVTYAMGWIGAKYTGESAADVSTRFFAMNVFCAPDGSEWNIPAFWLAVRIAIGDLS